MREVQAMTVAAYADETRLNGSLLSRSASRLRTLRDERLKALSGILNASGMKNLLKARLADATARQALEKYSATSKSLLAGLRSGNEKQDLSRMRVLAILNDLENGRDSILAGTAHNAAAKFSGDGSAASQNLAVAISSAHESERMNSLDATLKEFRIQNAFEEQKSALRQSVAFLEKSGWIGKVVHYIGAIIAPIASAAASLLVPVLGIASIVLQTLLAGLLRNAVNGILQAASWLAERSPSLGLSHTEIFLRNAEMDQHRLSRQNAESESSRNHAVMANDRLIRHLEEALRSR
jgi:hypothetical protein